MKSKRIILIRHGESEANVNTGVHRHTPDHAIALTSLGVEQAKDAGKKLFDMGPYVRAWSKIYCSPYERAKQTLENFGVSNFTDVVYDPRLREKEWGWYDSSCDRDEIIRRREKYGYFWHSYPHGENGCQVFDRVSSFIETMFREMEDEEYSMNKIIVSHGYAIRIFLMALLKLSVKEFDSLKNPDNCEIIVLELHDGKYRIKGNPDA